MHGYEDCEMAAARRRPDSIYSFRPRPLESAHYQGACVGFDCHSNQTGWRFYSYVAPVSWLVARDVNEGRRHLNFSAWDQPQKHAKDVAEQVKTGEMPLWFYVPLHPSAKLSDAEKQALIEGAAKSLGPQK
jgi:hypothetical protein